MDRRVQVLVDWVGSFKSRAAAARACNMTPQQLNDYLNKGVTPGADVLAVFVENGLDANLYLTGKPSAGLADDPADSLLDLEVIPLGELVSEAQRLHDRQGAVLARLRQATA